MIRYLPANSHVAMTQQGVELARWYDTKIAVDLPDELPTVQCPLRGQPVQSVTVKGYTIYFLASQARWKLSAADTAKIAAQKLYKLEYDIPVEQVENLENGHPSDWLWRHGVRSSKSVWVIPETRMPWARLNNFTEVGAEWEATKQDVSETGKILDSIIKGLQKELKAAVESAQESAQSAMAKVAEKDASDDVKMTEEKIRKYYFDFAKRVEKTYKERLNSLAEGAAIYGIDLNRLNLADVTATLDAVTVGMKERARLFAKSVKTLAAIGTAEATAVAKAVESNQMPVDIAADYLQENAKNATEVAEAESLRDAFKNAGDNEFSLLDDNNDAAA